MNFDLNNFLLAISDALDFVEIDILNATSNHSRRVAYISLRMGEHYGLSDIEKFDLCAYSILHDNGLSQEVLLEGIKTVETNDRLKHLEQYVIHCEIGEKNVEHFPFLSGHRNIIQYHHESWDGTGYYHLQGDQIPVLAQLIALADTVDNLFHFERPNVRNRQEIIEFVREHRGLWYSDRIVDVFLKISEKSGFWLDLQIPQLYEALDKLVPKFNMELETEQIQKISRSFMTIVDSKSKFTSRHSSGLEEKVQRMSRYYGYDEEKTRKLSIAADLHDLGKLAISGTILDKPGKLDYEEMEIMKSHVYYTRRALEKVDGFDEIVDWASNHHERLDGSGYPYGISAENLGHEERLMACLDIYQALTEDRPYRDGMSHDRAMEILYGQAQNGFLESGIVRDIDRVFQA